MAGGFYLTLFAISRFSHFKRSGTNSVKCGVKPSLAHSYDENAQNESSDLLAFTKKKKKSMLNDRACFGDKSVLS